MNAAALNPLPTLPTDWPRVQLRLPRLGECLVLALLLHALVVLVFGSAPGGSAKPGEGVAATSGPGVPRPESRTFNAP